MARQLGWKGWAAGAVAVSLLLAVALVGCGDDTTSTGGGTSMGEEGDVDALDGMTFTSTSVTGHQLVAGSQVALTFEDSRLGARAGCNSMGGDYVLDGDRLVVPGDLTSTMMGCDAALMAQDTWLAGWLTAGPTWALAGTELTLEGDGTTMVLQAESSGPGTGSPVGAFTLETITAGGTASSVPAGVDVPTLEITETTARVFTGCNQGSAIIVIGEGTITFEGLRTTLMACGPEAGAVEAAVTATLDGEVPFTVDGDQLTVGTDAAGLVWRRA